MSIKYNTSDELDILKEGLNSIIHTSEELKKYIIDLEEKIENPLKTHDLVGGKIEGGENIEMPFKIHERVGQIRGRRRLRYGTIIDVADDCILIKVATNYPSFWVKASEVISFENIGICDKLNPYEIIRILKNIEVENPKKSS